MLRHYALTITVVLGLACSPNGWAGGIMDKVPDDGSWSRYRIDSKVTVPPGRPDPIDNSPSSLKISLVGTTKVDGVRCRWLEIGVQRKGDKAGETEIFKLLIPEEHLGAGKLPLSYVKKAWRRARGAKVPGARQLNEPTQDMNLQNNRVYLLGLIDIAKSIGGVVEDKKTEKLNATVIECGLGKVECKGQRTSAKLTNKKVMMTGVVTETAYVHRDAPFGVVQTNVNATTNRDGTVLDTRDITLTLTQHGRNGKSALPDNN